MKALAVRIVTTHAPATRPSESRKAAVRKVAVVIDDCGASALPETAIASRGALFERNFAAGEIGRLVQDYFVPDALEPMLSGPGGRPPIVGREKLEHQFRSLRELYTAISIETTDIEAGTELVSQLGRVRLTRADGEIEIGRYTVLWRLCDDGWRAKLDFFAADAWPD